MGRHNREQSAPRRPLLCSKRAPPKFQEMIPSTSLERGDHPLEPEEPEDAWSWLNRRTMPVGQISVHMCARRGQAEANWLLPAHPVHGSVGTQKLKFLASSTRRSSVARAPLATCAEAGRNGFQKRGDERCRTRGPSRTIQPPGTFSFTMLAERVRAALRVKHACMCQPLAEGCFPVTAQMCAKAVSRICPGLWPRRRTTESESEETCIDQTRGALPAEARVLLRRRHPSDLVADIFCGDPSAEPLPATPRGRLFPCRRATASSPRRPHPRAYPATPRARAEKRRSARCACWGVVSRRPPHEASRPQV